MYNIILFNMYIYLLIQTLQCEQKHIIHESPLQTFNSPVNQLLLYPGCHYKCHSSLMLKNFMYVIPYSIWRFSFCTVLLVFSCSIFLVLLIIVFISSASLFLYNIMITLIGRADIFCCCLSACTLVCSHFCICPL